jgi:phage terminase large subunit-like protein
LILQTEIQNYCKDVLNDTVISCKYVKLAVKRFNKDLKRKDIYLDWEKANFAINFIQSINHVDGSQFILEAWQKFCLVNVFGFYYNNGERRFIKAYEEVPRKNGKTAKLAAIGLLGLADDEKKDAHIYVAATTKDQANICYNAAKQMARNSWLTEKDEGIVRITQYEMFNISEGYDTNNMKALASDSNNLDGLKPSIAIIDEFHAHKTDDIYNVIISGMGATQDPLLYVITTAGFNKNSPCFRERKYCIEILENKIQNDRYFTIIFTIDEGDDWKDHKTWAKANPNLGVSVKQSFLQSELIDALASGTKEINFKTKYLNLWTDTATTWISDENYMLCATNFDACDLIGRDCYGGLDLSKSQDFSSLCLLFPPINGEKDYKCLYYFWLPELTAKERHKRNYSNLLEWSEIGAINLTDGNVIDHQLIRNAINLLNENFRIKFINYDRAFATTLVTELTQDGIEMTPFGQGFMSMGAPTSEFERMILNKELNHGFNPVMRWMMGNILILRDAAGNMKIDKSNNDSKVDGPIANVMAIAAYMQSQVEKPIEKEYFFIKVR